MPQSEPILVQEVDRLNELAWRNRVNDSNSSLSWSREALSLAEQAGYVKGKAEALRTYGFCHIRLSQYREALRYLEPALSLFVQTGHLHGQSDVYEYLGIIKRGEGDNKASLEYLFKALEIRRQTNYQDGESLTYYHIGITYRYLGQLEIALEFLLKSLQLARQINYWVAESYSLHNIGVIYAEMGDLENALQYYGQSLRIRQSSGDKWGEAGCLDNMGLIYSRLGEHDKGAQHCLQSLDITRSTGDKKGEGNSLFHLGVIYAALEDYGQALFYANQSLVIRQEIGDKRGQLETLLFLLERLPDKASEKPETLLSEALRIGQEVQAKDLLAQIHRQQYIYLKAGGRHKQALSHLESQHQLEKELFNQSFNLKLSNLKITYQVEQSRKEAEILRLKNDILTMYVDENVLNFMSQGELQTSLTANETIEATVAFVDICGFTALSEREPPDLVIRLLNHYFEVMVREIIAHQGFVDKFMGDSVMAIFRNGDHAAQAVKACLSIRDKIRAIREPIPGRPDFTPEISIGINSGEMISGNIGSITLRRLDFTVIGDAVNLAQRLQSTASAGQILVTGDFHRKFGALFQCRQIGEMEFKNRQNPEIIFEVLKEVAR